MAKIPENVLNVLGECRADGNLLYLPSVQLDRKTYTEVNKVLENMGGKWNRKAKAHVFAEDDDVAEMLENVLLTQEVKDLKREYQFFPTPRAVAERMCEMTEIDSASEVLEQMQADDAERRKQYAQTLPKAIAIDFDGCLCANAYPDIGAPNWEIIVAAAAEQIAGAGLILWTCREGELLENALEACARWGLHFDAVNDSLPSWKKFYGNETRKVGATEYWDDKAYRVQNGKLMKEAAHEMA